ncbi:MAG: hypothetical protein ACRCTQ_05760 [Brevinemataceae bacterium]
MKRFILILTILLLNSCSVIRNTASYNPNFLDPINNKLYDRTDISIVFFAAEERVLINTKIDQQANGWYRLAEPESFGNNYAVYKLIGWGNYNNTYLGISILDNGNKITASLQSSKELAKNSIMQVSTASVELIENPMLSPAMYILSSVNTWAKTSRAGIFNPKNTLYYNFQVLNNDPLENWNGLLKLEDPNNTLNNINTETTFETNISHSKAIYRFNSKSEIVVLGIAIDLTSPFPKANFITNTVSAANLQLEVVNMAQRLDTNIHWEYGILDAIDTSDGILPTLGKNQWSKIINSQGQYNPQDAEIWDIDSDGNIATLYRTSIGAANTDCYILEKTTTAGVYRLINNLNTPAKYHLYYFAFKKENENNASFGIAKSIAEAQKQIQNNIAQQFRTYSLTKALPLLIDGSKIQTRTAEWGSTTAGGSVAGRSGLGAIVANNAIYFIGGYTTPFNLPSVQPRYPTGASELPNVFRNVFTLNNLDGDLNTAVFRDTGVSLVDPGVPGPNVQQAQTTLVSLNGNNTIFVYGSGALHEENFFYNNLATSTGWQGYIQATPPVQNRFHASFYSLDDKIFIAGGTINNDTPTTMASPPSLGTFTNDIWYTTRSSSGATWQKITDQADWPARTQGRILVIENRLILIGGYENRGGTVTPVNDVWESRDQGKTWKLINPGGNVGTTTSAGAPPKADSENAGMLAGVAYGSILFMVNPADRALFYSTDGGTSWYKSATGFGTTTPIYGAQLVAYNNHLYLLGGQTSSNPSSATVDTVIRKVPIKFQ